MHYKSLKTALGVLVLATLLALSATCALAAEASPAGSVKSLSGEAKVTRGGGAPVALAVGERIFENDVLTTGAGAALGLVMRDNTTLSLGPNSRLVVERYLFAPEKNALGTMLHLKKGSMACATGEMARLSPETMQFMAAGYTLGIRGTHFMVNIEADAENAGGQ